MPRNYHVTSHFTVMDTNEQQVFLYVQDDKVAHPVGNLFISDGHGIRYTHSLENIVKDGGSVDFEAVESMDGTFIANRYDYHHSAGNNKNAGHLREVTPEDILEEHYAQDERTRMHNSGNSNSKQMSTRDQSNRKIPGGYDYDFDQKIKTYITHNKGASWELIRAPEHDMKG